MRRGTGGGASAGEGLALEVGQLRERGVGHEAQLAAKDVALGAKDETIAELRRRAEAAEAERDALRAQASPQPPSATPPESAQADDSAPEQPTQRLWWRIRRVFSGE